MAQQPETPPTYAPVPPVQGSAPRRIVAFLVLIVSGELWARRHLGYGLTNPGRLGEWAAIVSAVLALLSRVFDQSRFRSLRQTLSSAADRLTATPVLVVGWAVLAYCVATRSSVTVLAPEGTAASTIQLEPLDPGYTSSPGDVQPGFTRFRVHVNPLGTPFRLRARGFVPASFEVPPLVGRTVRLEDLRPSPSVLVRPSLLAIRELEHGQIVVRKDDAHGPLLASSKGPTSLLVGPRRAIPLSMIEDWKLELDSQGVPEEAAATVFLAWKRARYVDSGIDLEPGMTLFARAETEHGTSVAEGQVRLGSEAVIELSLVDVPAR